MMNWILIQKATKLKLIDDVFRVIKRAANWEV